MKTIETVTVTEVEIKNNTQKVLDQFAMIAAGKSLIRVIREHVDPSWKQLINNNASGLDTALVPNKPIFMYSTEHIKIHSFRIIENDPNGKSYVIFNESDNKDPKHQLRFPFANVTDFKEVIPVPMVESVHKAILLEEATGQRTYFSDGAGVNAVLQQLNEDAKNALEALARRSLEFGKTIDGVQKAEDAKIPRSYSI